MARLTIRSQEAAVDKQQKRYKAKVKFLKIVVDDNYALASLLDKRKHILASYRGGRSDTPNQVRR